MIKTLDLNMLAQKYKEGETLAELAERFNVSERTISRRIKVLKRDNKIPEEKPRNDDIDFSINKQELLKLLAIYKTQVDVARKLEVSPKTISRFCSIYNIQDNKTYSDKLNQALQVLTKDYTPFQTIKKNVTSNETLVVGISDWHAGKIVKDCEDREVYNIDIFNKRIEKLIVSMLKLIDSHITKHVSLKEVYILCTGDMANGEGIYPTQIYEQEDSPPKQVMAVVENIMRLIMSLLERGLIVKFRGVKGNHGRLGKDADPASNWDLMIYMILQYIQQLKSIKNLDIKYSNKDYFVVPIRKWRYLLRHQGYPQDETAAGRAKYLGWLKIHDADLVVSGHYHHYDIKSRRIVIGSPVGADDLSERMAVTEGEPSQLLWLVTDERDHTDIYPVDLKSR
jgi:DNA-binding transcriptional ArsR family regulator